jgi:hypothetical protein
MFAGSAAARHGDGREFWLINRTAERNKVRCVDPRLSATIVSRRSTLGDALPKPVAIV